MPVDALSYMKYDENVLDRCLGQVSWISVHLEFHPIVKFQTDSCLECNGMITINSGDPSPQS